MSIITTGINIVATGVNRSVSEIKRFGQALTNTERQVNRFANRYQQQQKSMMKSTMGLSAALNRNWQNDFNAILRNNGRNQGKALKALEQEYDRTFRNIGNKYQSMVMGSVALSMSGIGIMNTGTAVLGASKVALDQARDFELVMSQIQFYGHRTANEMESIKKQIFEMGYELPVKTSEIGNSVLSAQKLGYDNVKSAMKMAEEASKIQFMSLGKMDGDESLKYISQFRKMTGYAVKDVDNLTDKLSKTADVSAASIDSLWKTIQSSRTAFDSLGGNEDTFLTLVGTMSDRLTPRNAGMALNSFAGGVQMAEKAGRENRGSRGEYYNQLKGAMGGGLDDFNGDIIKYIENVAVKSKELWGTGSERKGNLQSMFGKSAVDLFYAVDSAMKKTGKTMSEIRSEIEQSGGHAEAYMDVIMNTSYGTEMKLQAVKEQFQILFGTAIRPIFNKILTGIERVMAGINRFMVQHPKLTKVLGYGFGLTGLLLTATGATMLFVGGILAIYASLMNLFVQLARNTRVLNLLSSGYGSAGAMIRAQMLGPLALLGKSLLKISAITFFTYLAWKNDFLRMRTTFTAWKKEIGKGLKESKEMFKLYAEGSASALSYAFARNDREGGLDSWVANNLTKARMLWDGIRDIWGDGTISVEKYQMFKDAGILGVIEKVYELKTVATDFWKGFQGGMKDGMELLKTLLGPLIPIWNWISEKILGIFQHFGYFENVNKGIGSQWQQWGTKIGYIVGAAVAVRLALWGWLKALKLATSPFRIMYSFALKIGKVFDKLKNMGGIMGKMAKFAAKVLVPKPIRNVVAYGANRGRQRVVGPGASSRLPNARPVIDPTTGRPTGAVTYQQPRTWRERRQLRRERRLASGATREGLNGANATRRSRGLGRLRDMWRGETYLPEQRVDRRGRTYHQVRNRNGGVTRTDAQGRVRGQQLRTGGLRGAISNNRVLRRTRGLATLTNMINFADAGMDYGSSAGQRGHRRRSVVAGVRGFVNRSRRSGITAGGNSLASQLHNRRGEVSRLGGRGARAGARAGGGIGRALGGIGKGIGRASAGIGKGLLKGLGSVVTKGLPFIFKAGFRLIPFLGLALMAWDIIKLVFTNWDAIKNGAAKAWNWIKNDGVKFLGQTWEWIKTKAGETWAWIKTTASTAWTSIKTWAIEKFGGIWTDIKTKSSETWTSIKTKASEMWTSIKTTAGETWTNIKNGAREKLANFFQPIKDAWTSAKEFVTNNPITQTIKKVTQTVTESKLNPKNWFGHRTGLWKVPKDNYPAMLHNGEMVLTQKEAQIMRSIVGSDSNSIAQTLLGKSGTAGGDISISAPAKGKKGIKPNIRIQAQGVQGQTVQSGGDTQVTFGPGAVQISIANASAAEIKKGAKQMMEEFKRLLELENMKNYKPARPRRG